MQKLIVSLFLILSSVAVASTTSPNMNLVIPQVGDTDYPTSILNSFTLIDQHDHSAGKGVQVTAGGLASNAVTSVKIATAVAGDGLTGGGGSALAVNPDNTTLEISSDSVRIKDLGVSTAKLADNSVTYGKLAARATGTTVAAGGVAISATSGSFTTTATIPTVVPNLSVTITTTGRPVFVGMISDGTAVGEFVSTSSTNSLSFTSLYIRRDVTLIDKQELAISAAGATSSAYSAPCSIFNTVDAVAAGTYTYTINIKSGAADDTSSIGRCKLIAYEL